ncbi:MAG: LapA family protein [Myxococcota bacterium]
MQWLRTALVLAIALGLIWMGWSFRSGNAEPVDLDLVWFRMQNVPVWWALSLAVLAGTFAGGIVGGLAWLRQRLVNRRYRKTIERLESEVHQLRSLPLEAPAPAAGRTVAGTLAGRG